MEVKKMTWRPTQYLIEGELDNSVPGSIVGWLRFAGMDKRVDLELEGDFMSDIQGKKLTLSGRYTGSTREARKDMNGFRQQQRGRAGWITAGGPNDKKIEYPYIEWYSDGNDRVVLMPEHAQVAIVEAHYTRPPTRKTAC